MDAIRGTRTMLLFNFRDGHTAPWMSKFDYRQIRLSPLNHGDTEALLDDLLGEDSSLALISRNIAERAQGNPFFVEELVH